MALDLRTDGGTLVTATNVFRASIGVSDGRIAFIGDAPDAPPARETLDAADLTVMAGLIDPHVHLRDPDHTEREDWYLGSRVAAVGGVTCVLEHPNSVPSITNHANFHFKRRIAQAKAVVDFGLYGGVGFFDCPSGGRMPPNADDVQALVAVGVCCFKTFLWPYPDRKDEFDGITTLGEEEVAVVFSLIARTGKVIGERGSGAFVAVR